MTSIKSIKFRKEERNLHHRLKFHITDKPKFNSFFVILTHLNQDLQNGTSCAVYPYQQN
jgi:hypothetical protein